MATEIVKELPPTTADNIAVTYGQKYAAEIKGKVVLITGVSIGGVAFEAAKELAKHGAVLIITGRSPNKLQAATKELKSLFPAAEVHQIIVDLSLIANVKTAAKDISSLFPFIDIIINNAGLWSEHYSETSEGYETQLATNYLATFLLSNLLLEHNAKTSTTKPIRITSISSGAHHFGEIDFEDFKLGGEEKFQRWKGYAQSKIAVVLFGSEVRERWQKVFGDNLTANSVDPGLVYTPIITITLLQDIEKMGGDPVLVNPDGSINPNSPAWTSKESAAATYLVAAFDPALTSQNGAYVFNQAVTNERKSAGAASKEDAVKLWDVTEKLLDARYP